MNAAERNAKMREAANANYRPVLVKHHQLAALTEDKKNHYTMICKVGEGAYGEVFKARRKATEELVAIKVIRVNCAVQAENGLSLDLVREIKFLSQLAPYGQFVTLQDTFFAAGGDVFMVFEYMEADLAGVLQTPVVLSVAHVKCIMRQILDALRVLHSKSIMHRDCKASNLLLNGRGIVKLGDFGLATNYRTRDRFGCNVVTLWYRAPELLLGDEHYGPSVDIWSAGVILGELALRRHMFPGRNDQHQLQLIFEGCGVPSEETWPGVTRLPNWRAFGRVASQLRALTAHCLPPDGVQLLCELLALCPRDRPSADVALMSPYFTNAPVCQPADLPTFSPLHEFEARKARSEAQPAQQPAQLPVQQLPQQQQPAAATAAAAAAAAAAAQAPMGVAKKARVHE